MAKLCKYTNLYTCWRRFRRKGEKNLGLISLPKSYIIDFHFAEESIYMQNLINELNAGSTEYKDGGVIIQHPPTSLQLRTARALTEMLNINQANHNVIGQMQLHINELFELNNTLKAELDAARTISGSGPVVENVRNDQREAGDVERSDGDTSGSNPDSQGCGTVDTSTSEH